MWLLRSHVFDVPSGEYRLVPAPAPEETFFALPHLAARFSHLMSQVQSLSLTLHSSRAEYAAVASKLDRRRLNFKFVVSVRPPVPVCRRRGVCISAHVCVCVCLFWRQRGRASPRLRVYACACV